MNIKEKANNILAKLPFTALAEKIPAATRAKVPVLNKAIPLANHIACALVFVLVVKWRLFIKKVFVIVFLVIGYMVFAQMPNKEELRKSGENTVNTLMAEIGKPLPNNAVKIDNNTYQIDGGGIEGVSKIYYTQNNLVVGYGTAHRTAHEDISFVMFLTFGASLEAYLGKASFNDGVRSWSYGKYLILLPNPQNENGIYVVALIIIPK